MKLVYRIVAAPLIAICGLVVSGLFANHAVSEIVSKFGELRDSKLSAARALAEVDSKMAGVNALLYRTINVIDSSEASVVNAVREQIGKDADEAIATLKALAPQVDPGVVQDLGAVVDDLAKYKPRALQALTMAETSPGAAVLILSSAEKSFKSSALGLHKVAQSVNADVERLSGDVLQVSGRARLLILVFSVGTALASCGLAWWMARRLVGALDQAVRISEEVAQGRLDLEVPAGGTDEMGRLLDSLRHTVTRLAESLGSIQAATDSISTASSEIAAGSSDLSQRTEQTASSLQETASSVSLLASTVDESTSAAREASGLASSAATVAQRGGALVGEVVSTMQDINTSAKEIGAIISVIDGIAFQTNILALNAAVEAARAGEQGRGFAVVASEVRSLAQRSADAARQIKVLVGNSVDKSEVGTRLVGEAGATMSQIVEAVEHVSAMIAGISERAEEQNVSLARVNDAVGDLDRMTQQNAALVEQSAAAAESLKQQAARLGEVVGTFRFRT